MRRIFFAVFLVVSYATGAAAESYEDALSAFTQKDYALAARLFRPIAEQGNAKAQYNLGVMYDKGKGVPQDYQEALKWYRRAAEQGQVQAQNNLGVMYNDGQGVPQNAQEAAKWYRQAAGQVQAQYNLGVMYDKGEGVRQDYQEALKWYRKAAGQGHVRAQGNLALMYAKGLGVPQDFTRAYVWLYVPSTSLSGDEGKAAMKNRSHMVSQMTAAQIKKAQEMAQRCEETKFKECE